MSLPLGAPGEPPPVAGPPSHGGSAAGSAVRVPAADESPTAKRSRGRLLGGLLAVALVVGKYGAALLKVKAVGTLVSMLVSVAAYALFYGWSFAAGLVLLVLVHEMGHVVALRRMGIPATAPMFIPFLGAFVGLKKPHRSAWDEAVSGIAGPALGGLGVAGLAVVAAVTGSGFLQALAFTGFLINAFNLLPVLPLDGGRVAAAIHPGLWVLGFLALVGLLLRSGPSVVLLLVLVLGGAEVWSRWRARHTESSRLYYTLRQGQRWGMATAYVALAAALVWGTALTYVPRSL